MMNKFDINKNKLEICDIVVLCDCAEAISREFEFWVIFSDNKFTKHSVFIRGITTGKTDSFDCKCLKKVDKKYKELVEKATPKKPIGDFNSVPHYRCPNCMCTVKLYEDSHKYKYCLYCGQAIDWSDEE